MLCCFSSLFSFLIISVFSYPIERPYLLLIVILLSAFVVSKDKDILKKINLDNIKSMFIALLMLMLITFTYSNYRNEIEIKNIHKLRASGNWRALIQKSSRVISSNRQLDHFLLPITWYRGVAYFSTGEYEKALYDFESAYKISPNNVQVINNLASSYFATEKYNLAIEKYYRAIQIASDFDDARINLAKTLFIIGKHENCSDILAKVHDKNRADYLDVFEKINGTHINQ